MAKKKIKVSIVGASGYVGGELLRLLLNHPYVKIYQAVSRSFSGKTVASLNPNLRNITNLVFTTDEQLEKVDVIFLALPHTISMKIVDKYLPYTKKLIDLSADFRLKDPKQYEKYYQIKHTNQNMLKKFVYGIPEIHKKEIATTNLVASAGCLATATILGLYPLVKDGLIDKDKIFIDAKTGSSASGKELSLASHHPERSQVIRCYKPTGHRHIAEIEQELGFSNVNFSVSAVDTVRGILSVIQIITYDKLEKKDLFKVYKKYYQNCPFVSIVSQDKGLYRYPEPKILIGTNNCDIGFELDPFSKRIVIMVAIDNLVKGAAGQAIQSMNLMMGLDETMGLNIISPYPI